MRVEYVELRETTLDALVDIAEPLLEPQHLLSDDRETKVPGLDDAGMYGSDRDLVHAFALDAHEGVHVDARFMVSQRGCSARKRVESGRPGIVTQPRPRIRVRRADA